MDQDDNKIKVVVIGGGPAGLMAAGKAAEDGAQVILVEKNQSLGRKLLITGKGRCNITQAEFDDKEIIKRFGKSGKFLFSSLANFGPEEVINFFQSRGLPTKTERGGRVFPVSDRSMDVLRVMEKYLAEGKVKIIYNAKVSGFSLKEGRISHLKLNSGDVFGDNFIIATGGLSYPATGATGDGYIWLKEFGHTLITPRPALVPIKIKEQWVKDAQGLSLKNVSIKVIQDKKVQSERFGEMLFTHFGLSGPIILDVSKEVGKLLEKGAVSISLDLKPALSEEQLDERVRRDFEKNLKKDFINYLPDLMPQKMIPAILELSGMEAHKKVCLITKEERKKLINLIKNLPLTVEGVTGFSQAIVTSGGVALREVDSKTLHSRVVDNLFFAGEILDLDGPTGGYNLQMCWSTGYTAGFYAGKEKNY